MKCHHHSDNEQVQCNGSICRKNVSRIQGKCPFLDKYYWESRQGLPFIQELCEDPIICPRKMSRCFRSTINSQLWLGIEGTTVSGEDGNPMIWFSEEPGTEARDLNGRTGTRGWVAIPVSDVNAWMWSWNSLDPPNVLRRWGMRHVYWSRQKSDVLWQCPNDSKQMARHTISQSSWDTYSCSVGVTHNQNELQVAGIICKITWINRVVILAYKFHIKN